MSWFGSNKPVNVRLLLNEGEQRIWRLRFDISTPVSLFVQRLDGYGPSVYVMSDREYRNYEAGLAFKYITQLSYENIDYFSNEVTMPRGIFYLVVTLPRIHDGSNSYSEFNLRYEPIM